MMAIYTDVCVVAVYWFRAIQPGSFLHQSYALTLDGQGFLREQACIEVHPHFHRDPGPGVHPN